LKKRSKKLLTVGLGLAAGTRARRKQRDKSFLVLFFKKELLLPFLYSAFASRGVDPHPGPAHKGEGEGIGASAWGAGVGVAMVG
jgi:hypothetical protein